MSEQKCLELGKVEEKQEDKTIHMPSKIQADTLFNFVTKPEYLIKYLTSRKIAPRYCVEDIEYLDIPTIKKIAIPMKCFCDIKLSNMEEHMEWYGYYGIAFSKEWGMNKGIQSVQYINSKSELKKELSATFQIALEGEKSKKDSMETKLKSLMLNQLMYYKPYDGMMMKRNKSELKQDEDELKRKCLADECEWRFVPDVTQLGYQQIYYVEEIMNKDILDLYSNALENKPEVSLSFEYSEIKHIIVESKADLMKFVEEIHNLNLNELDKYELISKIIIWQEVKGDF